MLLDLLQQPDMVPQKASDNSARRRNHFCVTASAFCTNSTSVFSAYLFVHRVKTKKTMFIWHYRKTGYPLGSYNYIIR